MINRLIYHLFPLFILLFLVEISNVSLSAQVDTSVAGLVVDSFGLDAPQSGLPTVVFDPLTIKGVRRTTIGTQEENLHLGGNASNVGDLLTSQTGTFIKSYGLGSLATSSIRGGGGGHTAVLWNNFSIQSPMLGLLDLSSLPASFMEKATLTTGGASALWGSGAIGGVVSLNNENKFKNGLSVDVQSNWGSFGHLNQQLKIRFGRNKWGSATRVFYQQAQNDFRYFIREDLPKRQQINADIKQVGVLQSISYKIDDRQKVNAHFWWQKSNRGIPPTTVQNKSVARQKDETYRTTLDWKFVNHKVVLQARTALFIEDNFYEDEQILLENLNTFSTSINEVEGDYFLTSKTKIHLGSNYTFTKAKTGNYTNPIKQKRAAIFGAVQHDFEKWRVSVNARQEWVEEQSSVFVPAFSLEGKLHRNLLLKGQVSKNYRLPTLNDLYWNPGGNKDLLPETGWSEEVGLHFNTEKKDKENSFEFKYGITGFNRTINDWILWATKPNEVFYSAQNVASVWSRGVEQRMTFSFSKKNLKLQLKGGYDYIVSTNEAEAASLFDKGEQLIYTPKHQMFGTLSCDYKSYLFRYSHHFTGKTTTLNEPLKAYHLGDIHLSKSFEMNRVDLLVFTEIKNSWNANYQVIERRAMPGIHFVGGLTMQIK